MDGLRNDLKILVVDDEYDAADSLAALFTLTHYDARAAYGGQHAVTVARGFQPHVVFLDINMPRMDGYGTATALRQMFPKDQVLLIAFTAEPARVDKAAAEKAGFDLHVGKPCDFDDLLDLLAQAIARRFGRLEQAFW